jgi:hypothetical protein
MALDARTALDAFRSIRNWNVALLETVTPAQMERN